MVENRIRRISLALAKCKKEVKNGANQGHAPPWYGFKANLAIAGQLGIAAPSKPRVIEERNRGPVRCRSRI